MSKKQQDSDDEYFYQSDDLLDESDEGLGDDDATFDIDPDDEEDLNDDDKYDPINEIDEPVDTDEELAEDYGLSEEEMEEANEGIEVDDEGDEIDEEKYIPGSKTCYLKNLNEGDLVLDEDDSHMYGTMVSVELKGDDRVSKPTMTYYEMVRIIGTRARQFELGAPPLVKGIDNLHPAKMAFVELMAKKTPYVIKRPLPGKKYEKWRISELDIVHKITDPYFVPEGFDLDSVK